LPKPVALALRIGGGIALLAAMAWYIGPEKITGSLANADRRLFGLALVLGVCASLCSATRWAYIARALRLDAPSRRLIPMYGRAMTSNILLPGATVSGDLLRSYELSRRGNPLVDSMASVALDRLSGLWTLAVMSFVGAGVVVATGIEAAGVVPRRDVLTAYGVLLFAIVALPFIPWPIAWVRALPTTTAARIAALWERWQDPATRLKRRVAKSVALSVAVQLLCATELALCARALGLELPFVFMVAASAPIFVMAALPLGVAGFGTREIAAVTVLGLAGVAPGPAAATSVLFGLVGVLQGVLASPLFLARFAGRP